MLHKSPGTIEVPYCITKTLKEMIDREKMKFRFSVLMKETGESIPDDIVSYDDICEHLSSLAGLFEDGFAESLLISLATLRIGESHTCKIPVGESSVTRIA